jgi:hypothetical protein
MKSKFLPAPTWGFLLRFVVIFGLLIVPWPGWNQTYSHYFQIFGQSLFNSSSAMPRMIVFQPSPEKDSVRDTRVTLENATLADSNGNGPVRRTELDSRSIGWVPTALTMALVLATPIPWTRRLLALAGGLVLIHLFLIFTLQCWIWDNSADMSLLTLSNLGQRVIDEVNYALMNQLGASFSIPIVIWILVTFRRQDVHAV